MVETKTAFDVLVEMFVDVIDEQSMEWEVDRTNQVIKMWIVLDDEDEEDEEYEFGDDEITVNEDGVRLKFIGEWSVDQLQAVLTESISSTDLLENLDC